MSVYASKRSESKAEFIKVAQDLATYTLEQIKKFPKSYQFNLVGDIYRLSSEIHENVLRANSYYIHKGMLEQDFLKREAHLADARSAIFALSGKLTMTFAAVMKGNNFLGDKKKASNIFKEWARLLNYEAALVKGVIESDKKRYKRYQNQKKSPRKNDDQQENEVQDSDVILPEETFDIEEPT